ncbi:MAG: OsmC family protein [Deltaproteobacteria bacterium]|nr:OsmC family protein [Deltaproteobacteria bacterium]
MRATVTTYDALQHCTAITQPAGKGVAMDCARTGKGEEPSPNSLVEAAVGGAMLLAMGEEALEDETVDITGARADVRIQAGRYFEAIHVTIKMPAIESAEVRKKLERAAEAIALKHSFAPDVAIYVRYDYPDDD